MNDVLVSICLPVFNAATSIERCLDAVLAQDLEHAEIIVLDNASDDETVEIATRMLEGVARARVVRNEQNIGRIGNWNRALELAQGRYIKFALANDVLLKDSVKVLLDEAQRNADVVMIGTKPRLVTEIPVEVPAMPPRAGRRDSIERRDAGIFRRAWIQDRRTQRHVD
jgi:glycosyltransferase involved in cell wall biosynthesis